VQVLYFVQINGICLTIYHADIRGPLHVRGLLILLDTPSWAGWLDGLIGVIERPYYLSHSTEVRKTYHSHNNAQTNRNDSKNLVPLQLGLSRRPNNSNRLCAPVGIRWVAGGRIDDHGGICKGIPAFIGVPVLDLVQFRRGAALRGAVEQVRSKTKATASLGDASIVERAV
jgi:hypothetical protein